MRIIKYGTGREEEITCNNCGSIISYHKKEVRTSEIEIFGDWIGKEYIYCPVCGEEIVICAY